MSSKKGLGVRARRESAPELLLLDREPGLGSDSFASLEARGYRVQRVGTADEALAALRASWPVLVIMAAGGFARSSEVRAAARERDIPILDVVEGPGDVSELQGDADDWVTLASAAAELPARVEHLLRRNGRGDPSATVPPRTDARFLAMVIHDMRAPLNVISLSLRMINQAVPRGNPDLDEDLRFVEESFKQIERMLAQMSDYLRLYEGDAPLSVSEFSPARLVSELLEGRALKAGPKSTRVQLVLRDSCPAEAALDQQRARLALQYALINADAAANGGAVKVILTGEPERWVTEVVIDQPPPPSVGAIELRPDAFERLCGSAPERRGMDLAIVARVSQLFGGTARLDVLPEGGTAIVIDWPARIAER